MDCPICKWTPDNADYRFVYDTEFWRVVLAPNQSLVGRCVVHLKRHSGTLADLTHEEISDWLALVRVHEAALRSALGATMLNWSCYMNHAYREPLPNPHVHWWAVPRYNHQVSVCDWAFEDPEFGSPYDHYKWVEVPSAIQSEIVERIQLAIR